MLAHDLGLTLVLVLGQGRYQVHPQPHVQGHLEAVSTIERVGRARLGVQGNRLKDKRVSATPEQTRRIPGSQALNMRDPGHPGRASATTGMREGTENVVVMELTILRSGKPGNRLGKSM